MKPLSSDAFGPSLQFEEASSVHDDKNRLSQERTEEKLPAKETRLGEEKKHHRTELSNKLVALLRSSTKAIPLLDTEAVPALQRRKSFSSHSSGPLKSLPFDSEFLHLMQESTGKTSNTLKWGTLQKPRQKEGKSTIKSFEREGNVETGKPKVNKSLFFLGEDETALLTAIEDVRNGGRSIVFGVNKEGRCPMAQEEVVPDVKVKDEDGNEIDGLLGHGSLGEEELRISGEILMLKYDKKHLLYDPENPNKKRLVLMNKSGRFGREGVRTEDQLLNVEAWLAKSGVKVDEIIFRKKVGDITTDKTLGI